MQVGQGTCLGGACFRAAALLAVGCLSTTGVCAAGGVGESSDLSGRVIAQITRQSRDNFSSELRYEVRARNLTNQAYEADSLVIILEELKNFAGQTIDPVSKQPLIEQVDVLGNDGTTDDGKPYFHVPLQGQEEFGPYAKSESVTVRLRNSGFITGLAPTFKVLGQAKEKPPAESPKTPAASPTPRQVAPSPEPELDKKFDALIDVLLKKGVFTRDEWREILRSGNQRSE